MTTSLRAITARVVVIVHVHTKKYICLYCDARPLGSLGFEMNSCPFFPGTTTTTSWQALCLDQRVQCKLSGREPGTAVLGLMSDEEQIPRH
jgi:hypothetical protein